MNDYSTKLGIITAGIRCPADEGGRSRTGEGEDAMKIYVLLKQTFDTEERIVLQDGAVSEEGVRYIINPYDEYAVEEAVRIRDACGGTVYVVTAGPERASEALRTALAMGADEAVHIEEVPDADEAVTSRLLAAYLKQQEPDLILGGFFSIDQGAGQTAIRVAELLDMPHVSAVTKLTVETGTARCERDAEGDIQRLEVQLPAVITAQQGLNEPRYPSLPGIMKAKRKPYHRISLEQLGLKPEELSPRRKRLIVTLPPARSEGRILTGTLEEQVQALIAHLRQVEKVI